MEDYTDEQKEIIQVNSKAKNMLYSALNSEKYENIYFCETAKEMLDKFEVTYEETEKIKQTLVSLLVFVYEFFNMKDGDSIEETLSNFGKWLENSSMQEKLTF